MSRTTRVLAWILVGLVAVAPLSAAVYTVSLNNGTSFETRYEPRNAPWDPNKIVFLDEWGTLISLSKDDVTEVVSDFEAKGFGRIIDDTTMELGFAPNDSIDPDSPEGQQAAATAATAAAQQAAGQETITYDQFVEPNQTQGMPAQWVGYPVNLEQGNQAAPPPQQNQ